MDDERDLAEVDTNMHDLVKITVNDDGETERNPLWHLVSPNDGMGRHALCTGEMFGEGEGIAEFEEKSVSRGGITCPNCLAIIKAIKSVRL